MFCHICGTQIPEDAGFCHNCGTKVVYEDSADAKQVTYDSRDKISSMKDNVNRKLAKIVFVILAAIIIVVLIRTVISHNSDYVSDDDMMEYNEFAEDYEEDNYEQYPNLDSSLVGRWRSYDGGTLEFSDSGIITFCDFQCWSLKGQEPDLVYWEASNGRVTCSAYFYNDFKYRMWTQFEGEKYEEERLNVGGGDSDYYRISGTHGNIVGKWVSVWSGWWSYQFNEDGTGMYNERYPITWYTYTKDDGTSMLGYTVVDDTYFDYTITGDTLTVFLSDSSRIYTKVGE